MIIIDKWSELPTTYTILFPTSGRIDINDFYDLIDAMLSSTIVEDIIDCNGDDITDIIDCGDSQGSGGGAVATLVLVNSSNYHTYEYSVSPYRATSIYVQFDLEILDEIECGDYQAFFVIDGRSVSTTRFRIQAPKTPYNQYNPNRDIIIYER